jgi:hypothetical protein
MGFVAALFVGIGLAVLLGLSAFVPAVATAFVAAGRSPIASVLLWVAVAVCVLFVGNAIAEPKRAFDYGFFVPTGALYGLACGMAFWLFTGARAG